MGRDKKNKPRRERPLPARTHEPDAALPGWPWSHVNAELTDDAEDECIRITVHGVEHLLHATTASALRDRLTDVLKEYNDGVREALADPQTKAAMLALGSHLAPGKQVDEEDFIV